MTEEYMTASALKAARSQLRHLDHHLAKLRTRLPRPSEQVAELEARHASVEATIRQLIEPNADAASYTQVELV